MAYEGRNLFWLRVLEAQSMAPASAWLLVRASRQDKQMKTKEEETKQYGTLSQKLIPSPRTSTPSQSLLTGLPTYLLSTQLQIKLQHKVWRRQTIWKPQLFEGGCFCITPLFVSRAVEGAIISVMRSYN